MTNRLGHLLADKNCLLADRLEHAPLLVAKANCDIPQYLSASGRGGERAWRQPTVSTGE